MIGKLYNAADGWIVFYKEEQSNGGKVLPLHHSDINSDTEVNWNLFYNEGSNVEFDIISEYSVTEKREVQYAKLKFNDKQIQTTIDTTKPFVSDNFQIGPNGAYENKGWDVIFEMWMKSKAYSKTVDGLQEFLEKNYLSPDKK